MAITGHLSGTLKFGAQSDSIPDQVFLRYLMWVSPAAGAGDALEVRDGNGDVIMASNALGGNFVDVQTIKKWVTGINVQTMASGILYAILG